MLCVREVYVTNCSRKDVIKLDKMSDELLMHYATKVHISTDSHDLIQELIKRWKDDKSRIKD